MEDRSLVDDFVRDRSDEAFRALYRSYAPVMYRLIVRLLGREGAEAEDALQDAWIRAAERLDQFRWESSLRTWLCGIAVNCCRERLRRGLPFAGPEYRAEHLTSAGRPWQSVDLERAIARLPTGGRAVFVLHDMLLLYGAGSTPEEEPRQVSEYRAWAGSIASRGARVSGEKLEDRAILLGAPPGAHLDPAELGGFFIVSAPDDASAEELARTHPHLKYGGRVVIRPIATLR